MSWLYEVKIILQYYVIYAEKFSTSINFYYIFRRKTETIISELKKINYWKK